MQSIRSRRAVPGRAAAAKRCPLAERNWSQRAAAKKIGHIERIQQVTINSERNFV
jgi:hypothetical protein